jgi:hypothetical protein
MIANNDLIIEIMLEEDARVFRNWTTPEELVRFQIDNRFAQYGKLIVARCQERVDHVLKCHDANRYPRRYAYRTFPVERIVHDVLVTPAIGLIPAR